jgi:thiol-disulfide isomerase/thioredoxin
VFDGTTSEDGTITVEHLSAQDSASSPATMYGVRTGRESIGYIRFTDDKKTAEMTFRMPLVEGDMVPDLDLVEVGTDRQTKLSDQRGKIVWLEFWATWCGPCQPAMAELVKEVGEHGSEWADKVSIIPLSVDDTTEVVIRHTKDRAWDKLPHYWSARNEDRGGFGSSAAGAFGVHGVPHAYLIGRDGRILWSGHPMGIGGGKKPADLIADALAK